MTRKERVLAALNHQEADIVPYFVEFTGQEKENIAAYMKNPDFENDCGLHLHYIQYWGWPTERPDKPDHFVDEFGVEWNRSGLDKDIGNVDHPMFTDVDEEIEYKFPVPDIDRLRKEYEELVRTKEDKFCMAGFGFCMYERSWSLLGIEHVLMRMLIDPESLEKLYDEICDYFMQLLDVALEYDIDGVYFGDDWGQQKGMIMGAGHWRRFIKPRMKRLYDRVHSKGKYVFQHSCGDCSEIMPELIEIGLNCYQTFQPEIYNIVEMKEKYGDKLTFWGGISTQQLLATATPEEVQKETVRIMNIMKKNGGYIAAPTHAVAFDVPPENVTAMMDVFMNQDKYLQGK